MTLKTCGFSFFSFVLGVAFAAAIMPGVSLIESRAAMNIEDDRAADRQAIRAHIENQVSSSQLFKTRLSADYADYADKKV